MIISIHQPAYLPWLGYFDKIAKADVFVFLDTVQFEKNSFINRNRIKTSDGSQWLTIPVLSKGHTTSSLIETEIDSTQPWQSKHLKTIALHYRKAAYFKECFPKIETLLSTSEINLSELCWRQLQFWLAELQIKTAIYRSSELPITSKKSNLVLDLCKHFDATYYLSGAMGKNYLHEASFTTAGIQIEYQDFGHPIYTQLWGTFEPNMSIIDIWMNHGPDARNILIGNKYGV